MSRKIASWRWSSGIFSYARSIRSRRASICRWDSRCVYLLERAHPYRDPKDFPAPSLFRGPSQDWRRLLPTVGYRVAARCIIFHVEALRTRWFRRSLACRDQHLLTQDALPTQRSFAWALRLRRPCHDVLGLLRRENVKSIFPNILSLSLYLSLSSVSCICIPCVLNLPHTEHTLRQGLQYCTPILPWSDVGSNCPLVSRALRVKFFVSSLRPLRARPCIAFMKRNT